MPSRFHCVVLCSAALSALHAQAPQAVPAADYSKESYVVERVASEANFENDGSNTRKVNVRVRLQSDAAVQHFAVLMLPYQSFSESLEINFVRVVKPGGEVVLTPQENVQDLPSEITQHAPQYSDAREKHIAVRGLGVGAVLEYEANWRTTKPLAPGQFWFTYNFNESEITLDAKLRVSVPRERAVKWRSPKCKPAITEAGGRQVFTWTASVLARKSNEQQEADQKTLMYLLGRARAPQPDIQMSSFQSWEELGRWYYKLQGERAAPTSEIRAKAEELTRGLSDDGAKARALYAYVSGQIHYISISFGIGRLQPHAAGDVLANQFGDCKDKHTLLAALLESVGIKAYPVLISSARELDAEVPSPVQFDHLITAIRFGPALTWVDATPEVSRFGYLIGRLRGKQALLVTTDPAPGLIASPREPPGRPLQTFRIDAKLDANSTLEGKAKWTFQNDDTEVFLRAAFRGLAAEKWKDLIQALVKAEGFAGEVSETQVSSLTQLDEPLGITYHYLRKEYSEWSIHRVSAPLPTFTLPAFPTNGEKMLNPILLGPHEEIQSESHVELPKGFRAKLDPDLDMTETFADYHRAYSTKAGILTTERRLLTKQEEVPVAQAELYKQFAQHVEKDTGWRLAAVADRWAFSDYGSELAELPASENPDAVRAELECHESAAKHDYIGAIAAAKRAVEADPKSLRAWILLGEAYRTAGQPSESIDAFRKGVVADPADAAGYKILAVTLTYQSRALEAIPIWTQLIGLNPRDPSGPFGLGQCLLSLHQYREAKQAFEKAAEIAPESATVHMGLGTLNLRMGDMSAALAEFRKAVEFEPTPDRYNAIALDLAEVNGQIPTAIEYARKAVAGESQISREVKLSALRAEDLEPSRVLPMYWDTLGWLYFEAGKVGEAEKYLNAAWTLGQHGEAADHLGQLYEFEKKTDAAVHMYKLAISRGPQGKPGGSMLKTAARLARLSPGASSRNNEASELSSMRTIHLPPLSRDGNAEFFLVFSADPTTAEVRPEGAKFISGSDSLKGADSALKSAHFHVTLPAEGSPRLLRRGILGCYHTSGCAFTFYNPQDVRSID